jgi:probable rRNA maturation factor
MPPIRVSINNQQDVIEIDQQRVVDAIRRVLAAHDVTTAEVSVAVVDDARIHTLNRVHLNHDYPTDVLSFVYNTNANAVDGELVVSAETARRVCGEHGMAAHDELLLYVVHGTLHLVGYDDQTDDARRIMHAQEQAVLQQMEVTLPGQTPIGKK